MYVASTHLSFFLSLFACRMELLLLCFPLLFASPPPPVCLEGGIFFLYLRPFFLFLLSLKFPLLFFFRRPHDSSLTVWESAQVLFPHRLSIFFPFSVSFLDVCVCGEGEAPTARRGSFTTATCALLALCFFFLWCGRRRVCEKEGTCSRVAAVLEKGISSFLSVFFTSYSSSSPSLDTFGTIFFCLFLSYFPPPFEGRKYTQSVSCVYAECKLKKKKKDNYEIRSSRKHCFFTQVWGVAVRAGFCGCPLP